MSFERTKASTAGAKSEKDSDSKTEETKSKDREASEDTSDDEEDKTELEDDAGDDDKSEPDNNEENNGNDSEVSALRKENSRLRELANIGKTDIETPRAPGLSPAQKDLYGSWQEEIKNDFLEKYPQYQDDPKLWKQFVEEFNDRISIIQLAKRKGKPVSKSLILERFSSVHKSIGSNMDIDRAREAGKAQAIKSSSRAAIATAGSPSGTRSGGKPIQERQRIIPRQSGSIKDWFPSKKK